MGTQEDIDTTEVRVPPRASRDLRREHVHVLRMLKIMEALQTRIAAGETPPADDWADIVTFLRVFVDRCHHGKEERVLFPSAMLVADDETKHLIEELLVEHVEGRRLVALLEAAGSGDGRAFDPAGAGEAITAYVDLIRPHVVHEEKHVYPAADGMLTPELQETIQGEYARIEAEVTGAGLHEAFEETVERLRDRYLPRGHR